MTNSILIIDDNEDILEFLTEVLGGDYELHLVTNGLAALEVLENTMVNLIISDVMMPGIDGFQLVSQIKANLQYCHIPVILLTAKNTYSAHIEGLEVGADAYIKKPFSPELLQFQISNLLTNRSKIKAHFSSLPDKASLMLLSGKDEQFMKKIEEYIQRNIRDQRLDIDKLADHMNMSRPTFYRKIKSISDLSPKELIDLTRLNKAAALMAQNEYSLSEVSRLVGHSSQSFFCRKFHKHFKVSPTEYMKQLRNNSTQQE